MAFETDTKKKRTSTSTDNSGSAVTLDDLYDLLNTKQSREERNVAPSVIPIGGTNTPTMPMQILGQQVYNNNPYMYVPPSYEGLKELSIKRDAKAKNVNNFYAKAKETLSNLGVNKNDPNYAQVQVLMDEKLTEYEENLKAGDWATQEGKAKEYVKDLMENKGGNTMLQIRQRISERQSEIDEYAKKYDPDTQTNGIRTDKIAYYNTPEYLPMTIQDGKVYGGGVRFKEVFEERNIPKEINDFVKDAKASATPLGMQRDEEGNLVEMYQFGTNLPYQYKELNSKAVTADQIATAAQNYINNTGGREYLANEARIANFNNPATVESTRQILEELEKNSSKDENGNNAYTNLLALSDDELQAKIDKEGLGERVLQAQQTSSLLSGAIALHSFTELTTKDVKDDQGYKAWELEESSKYKISGDGDGSGGGGGDGLNTGVTPYYIPTEPIGIIQEHNPDFIVNTYKRQQNITAQLAQIQKNIDEAKKTDPNYTKSAQFVNYNEQYRRLDEELKILNDNIKTQYKQMGNVIYNGTTKEMDGKKIALTMNTMYDHYANQAMFGNGKKSPLSREQFSTIISTAISAESDDDNSTTAAQILKENGINPTIDFNGHKSGNIANTNFRGFKYTRQTGTKLDKDMDGFSVQPVLQTMNHGDLVGAIKASAYYYKNTIKKQDELFRKVRNGTATDKEIAEIKGFEAMYSQDLNVLRPIIGDTEKYPESKLYNNVLDGLGKYFDYDTTMVTDDNGKQVSMAVYFKDKFNIDRGDLGLVFEDKVEMGVSVTQNYKGGKARLLFAPSLKVKDTDEKTDKNAYKLQKRVRELFSNGRVTMRASIRNQDQAEKDMYGAMQAVYEANNSVFNRMPDHTKNALALSIGNVTGINEQIDSLHLYTLNPNSKDGKNAFRTVDIGGGESFQITAVGELGKRGSILNKNFRVQKDGKYLSVRNGEAAYLSMDELNKKENQGYIIKEFDTDLDLKAWLSRGFLDQEQANRQMSFNKGGGGNSAGVRPGKDIATNINGPTYKVNVDVNGKSYVLESFVPASALSNLRGKVKISDTAGISYIHKSVEASAVRLLNDFGLTMTGGMRGKNYDVEGGATTSSHKSGYALDIRNDAQSKKFYAALKKDPSLATKYGIQFHLDHDAGTGQHLHITFNPKTKKTQDRTTIPFNGSKFLAGLSLGESSNRDLGLHFPNSNLTTYGRYGLTEHIQKQGANFFGVSVDYFKNNRNLVEKYLSGHYVTSAFNELGKHKDILKRKYNLSDQDVMYAYHYVGGNKLKDIANGKLSLDYIPSDMSPLNKDSVRRYITKKNT